MIDMKIPQALGLLPKGPLEGKTVVFNKMFYRNRIPFKNHEICRKIWKIGSRDYLGVTPSFQDNVLGLNKYYLMKP